MLLAPPLLAALLAVVVVPYRAVVGWAGALLSLLTLAAAVTVCRRVLDGDVLTAGAHDVLRADALSALLIVCVSIVSALGAWLGPGLERERAGGYDRSQVRRFRIFSSLLSFTMLVAVTSNNVGSMWIAIE